MKHQARNISPGVNLSALVAVFCCALVAAFSVDVSSTKAEVTLQGAVQGYNQMSSLYSKFTSNPSLSSLLPTQEIANQIIGRVTSSILPTDALLSKLKGSWSADAQCAPVIQACPCGTVPSTHGCVPGTNMFLCPCWDLTFGFKTAGICLANKICKAVSFSDIFGNTTQINDNSQNNTTSGGAGSQDTDSQGSLSASVLQSGDNQGCSDYHRVSVKTTDPCAIYIPDTSSSELSRNSTSQLLDSFQPSSTDDVSLSWENSANTSVSPPPTATQTVGVGIIGSPPTPFQNQTGSSLPGANSGIKLTPTSATIQTGIKNVELNTETVGFFGSDVPQNAQPQTFIERMCLVRPWQSQFVSQNIPASLFDYLCSSKGYRVGILPEATPITVKTSSKTADVSGDIKPVEVAKLKGPYVAPRVYINAKPTSVSLGSRATIAWTSQGVDSCIESSPGGSFSSNTLRGESSTVPISAPTLFSISCTAPDGTQVTDSVTVNLAI